MTLTPKQIKALDTITFHLEDIKRGLEFGQFLPEDVEAIRQACDVLVSPWISVEERMPKGHHEQYLVLNYRKETWMAYYADTQKGAIKPGLFYMFDNNGYEYETYRITHWQPLPDLPEVE